MGLTFTGSLSVGEAGRTEVRTMLPGALGCNLAWGVIDGVFYLMGCLEEAARKIMVWDAVRKSPDPEGAQRALAGALAEVVAEPDRARPEVFVVVPGLEMQPAVIRHDAAADVEARVNSSRERYDLAFWRRQKKRVNADAIFSVRGGES